MVGHSPKVDAVERGDSDDQSLDVAFDLLANQRRQVALACLTDHSQAMTLTDLAEDVAVRENEGPITEVPNEETRRIHTSLYHNHVPKLADAGAVEYDSDRDLVRISETTDVVERVHFLAANGGGEQ